MSDILELQKQLMPFLRTGDLAQCERMLTEQLLALPRSPFHAILEISITTAPEAVAEWFDGFFQRQGTHFKIGAAYAEMNGFCINPDLWFYNAFAYEKYGGHKDYDWLSLWQSEDPECVAIEGLESLQKVYASDAFRDKRFSDAVDLTDMLVVVKFQGLIQRASRHMQKLDFPLLATAHDYDFIYEARRDA